MVPNARLEHLALVASAPSGALREVGPRRALPSGGLIAMGNLRNLTRDLLAGLLALTLRQVRFLRGARGRYDAVVAVGDVYALGMALLARRPTIFVGSAKSIEVAPYGAFERRMLARAAVCFVRDDATAQALRRGGVRAEAANAIVDLFSTPQAYDAHAAVEAFSPVLALFPGSRASAYGDAEFLLDVTGALACEHPALGAVLSIAPGLEVDRFAEDARRTGWDVRTTPNDSVPFVLGRDGREIVRAWCGPLGSILSRAVLVLGQAGTANEAAAAAGVAVVAFERNCDTSVRWYRERQRGLLDGALVVFSGALTEAVAGVNAILGDPARRRRMGEIGRARMGEPGAARRIAERIAALLGAV